MQKITIGECCADCFAAINYNPREMLPDAAEAARIAGEKLSRLCDAEGVQSLHTGDFAGFSTRTCAGCRSELGGDRWPLIGLKEGRGA